MSKRIRRLTISIRLGVPWAFEAIGFSLLTYAAWMVAPVAGTITAGLLFVAYANLRLK